MNNSVRLEEASLLLTRGARLLGGCSDAAVGGEIGISVPSMMDFSQYDCWNPPAPNTNGTLAFHEF